MTSDDSWNQRQPLVFIQDSLNVARPLSAVRSHLESASWVASLVAGTGASGTSLAPVSREPDGSVGSAEVAAAEPTGPEIHIHLGSPSSQDSGVVFPVRWSTSRLRTRFPVLEGDLQLDQRAEGTQLSLVASYRSPMDDRGSVPERALLHRLAEATVRSFLHRVAAGLEDAAA